MWIEDGWTCDEDLNNGYPFNTVADLAPYIDWSIFKTPWTVDNRYNYGYPYISSSDLADINDRTLYKSLWQFDSEYVYGYPFIMKAAALTPPTPIRVGSKDVKIIINKSRLVTRVYVGDILIEDYLDNN